MFFLQTVFGRTKKNTYYEKYNIPFDVLSKWTTFDSSIVPSTKLLSPPLLSVTSSPKLRTRSRRGFLIVRNGASGLTPKISSALLVSLLRAPSCLLIGGRLISPSPAGLKVSLTYRPSRLKAAWLRTFASGTACWKSARLCHTSVESKFGSSSYIECLSPTIGGAECVMPHSESVSLRVLAEDHWSCLLPKCFSLWTSRASAREGESELYCDSRLRWDSKDSSQSFGGRGM